MDSQTNALFDNQTLAKHGISELSFNSVSSHKNVKTTKLPSAASSQATTPCSKSKKFVVLPADSKKALESSTSPYLSPSASFVKSKLHHSMKSLKLGE